jgi:hypothetical protein
MKLESYRKLVAAGGLYDLLVSAPFATPWTAKLVLETMARLHEALHVGGAPAPAFAPLPLVFVAFFGTVVTLWSLVRMVYRRPVDGGIDALGRIAFASWMAWGLAQGASHLLVVFLVLELGFALAQGLGYLRLGARPARELASPAA